MSKLKVGLRSVLVLLVVGVWACGLLTAGHGAETASDAVRENHIRHGPILGRLSSSGVGVWARTARPGTFRVRYGLAPGILDQTSDQATTDASHDNAAWVSLKDLKPDTRYYYEAVGPRGLVEPKASPPRSGSFRTLPDGRRRVDRELNPKGLFNFSFEFGCGNNQNPGQGSGPALPAFKTMLGQLKDRIYFSIQNGDWLYEDQRDFPAEQWVREMGVRPRIVQIAPTIVGVWENYKLYLDRGLNVAAYHRFIPTFFTFDDHEILNDVWGAGTPGRRNRRAVFRDIGIQAWYDYLGWSNPVAFEQGIRFGTAELRSGRDVLTDMDADFRTLDRKQAANLHVHWGGPTAGVNDNALDGVGGDPNAGVYEIVEILDEHRLRIRPAPPHDGRASYSIGRLSYYHFRVSNCDFFVLDTRSHRQMHDTQRPDQPGLSMLGARQKQWLLDAMAASDAEFFFVVSSVNFMIPHVGGGAIVAQNKDDAWTVFLDEREQLIEAWDQLNRPVFVLTGDLHNSFVIKITDRVWEFASGPHNSNNHWYTDEGRRPATGRFQYGPRPCDIRWSSFFRDDIPRRQLLHPFYCVVQVNNVFNNPVRLGEDRWVAFERPQVVFQYYDGRTGHLRYAEAIPAVRP